MLSLTNQLIHNTIRIETNLGTGTGFFFEFRIGENRVPVIITNKHVVRGAEKGRIIFKLKNKEGDWKIGENFVVEINNFEKYWISHPEQIDLCIFPIAPTLNEIMKQGKMPFFISITEDLIPSLDEEKNFTSIEEITMIGYPNGIWDSVNNVPIVRQGITATPINLEHNGKPEFLVDAACFPGSSGSPIFLLNLGMYSDGRGTTNIGNRIKFLGILWGGPQYTAEGGVEIIEVPTTQKSVSLTSIPNNLGYVIKSRKLLDFKPELEKIIGMS